MELRQQLLSLQYACWGLLCMVLYHAPNQRSLSLPYWGRGWMGQWQACSGPCGACESTRNVLVDCHIAPPCSQYTARQSMKNYFCFLVLLIFLRGAISALLQGTGHLLQTGEHYVHVRFLAARRGVQHTQQRLILRADDAHVQRAVFVWEIPSRLQPTLEVALREPTPGADSRGPFFLAALAAQWTPRTAQYVRAHQDSAACSFVFAPHATEKLNEVHRSANFFALSFSVPASRLWCSNNSKPLATASNTCTTPQQLNSQRQSSVVYRSWISTERVCLPNPVCATRHPL